MNRDRDTLLPCPFCQGAAEMIERENPMSKWRWSVDCTSSQCGMSGPVTANKSDAIAAWNVRAIPVGASVNPMSPAEEVLRKTIAAYPRDLSGFSGDRLARLRLTVLVDDLNVILGDLDAYRRTLATMAALPVGGGVEEAGIEAMRLNAEAVVRNSEMGHDHIGATQAARDLLRVLAALSPRSADGEKT